MYSSVTESSAMPVSDRWYSRIQTVHRRIDIQCAELVQVSRYITTHGADSGARETVLAIVHFFDHECSDFRDEMEQDLYPLLTRTALPTSSAKTVADTVDRLTAGRAEIELIWAALHKELNLVGGGGKEWLRRTQVRRFVTLNIDQMALERTELLPLVAQALPRNA